MDVEQVALVRHDHMIAIAAVREHAEKLWFAAKLPLTCLADIAFAATDPRKHQPCVADLHIFDVRSDRHDLADNLMAHGQRQLDAAIQQVHALLASAHLIEAVPDVQVAVADAGGFDLEQHFAARRLRRGALHALQRRAALADIK